MGTYLAGSWPGVALQRRDTDSIRLGPPPPRARSTASRAAASRPQHVRTVDPTPGIPYAAARSAIVGTENSSSFGAEYAKRLLFTTHTTGSCANADMLSDSCQRPFDVEPSPQIAIATRGSPRRW